MTDIKAAQFLEVSAGKLIKLEYANKAWDFLFESGLQVISYAGWNLFEHAYGAKPLIGSRDLETSQDPLQAMEEFLSNAACEMITHNALSNHTRLEFLRGDDQLSLELLTNSVKSANWKIISSDQETTDID